MSICTWLALTGLGATNFFFLKKTEEMAQQLREQSSCRGPASLPRVRQATLHLPQSTSEDMVPSRGGTYTHVVHIHSHKAHICTPINKQIFTKIRDEVGRETAGG